MKPSRKVILIILVLSTLGPFASILRGDIREQNLRSSRFGSSVRRTGPNEWKVVVSATERWFDTGIEVSRGAKLIITASGAVTWAPPGGRNMSSTVGPNGTRPPFPQDSPRFPVPDAGCGSLVMRIGPSTFAVGEARTIEVQNAGTVQLMVNDDVLSDNSGSFEVNIKLNEPPQRISQTLIRPLPEGTYRSAQGFKGTAYDPNLFHLGKDYCVDASADKTGTKLTGTRFYAIGRGTVVDVRFGEPAHRSDGVGNYITIDHGNRLIAVYMHLAKVFVRPGQGVDSTTPLGEAGDVILHPLPNCGHLHLEIRSNGVTSLNVSPNLRYSYASRDGKTRYSRPLGDERAVIAWIDANFVDPERILSSRRGGSDGLVDQVVSKNIEVPANRMWTDTGADVKVGDVITIEASGEVNGSLRNNAANRWVGPDGWARPPTIPSYSKATWVLGRGTSFMCLTGKIGESGEPLKIGSSYSFTARTSGILFLGINDEVVDENGNIVSDEGLGWKDNAGSFSVQINIRR